jgi:hypothetical protein
MFSERLLQRDVCEAAFSDPIVYSYNNSLGLPAAREAAAYFLAKRFVAPSRQLSMEMALQIVNPEHVALGSGCNAMLSNLCLALAEKGEAVLIPAPYYAAFEVDMKVNILMYCQNLYYDHHGNACIIPGVLTIYFVFLLGNCRASGISSCA